MNGRRRCDSLAALIHTLSRRLNAASAQEGLSPAQASVLAVVADRGTVGLGELSEIEGLNPTALSRLVGKLETFGLVRQLCYPDDHRAELVEVTRAGEKTWRLIAAERAELISELLACLTADEESALLAALPVWEKLSESCRRAPHA